MQQMNRLEREMKQWEAREQRFAKLFSPSILHSRAFKKEKALHLRKLVSQFRWTNDPEERMTRKLLGQERRQLEKELYPNRLKRNFMRFVGSLGRLTNALVKPPMLKPNHTQASAGLKRAGFGGMQEKFHQQKGNGLEAFNIVDVRKVNDRQRLEYRPEFRKEQDGQLRYDGHSVSLTGEGKTASYRMDADAMRLGEQRAVNLLSGRSVLVKGQWLSLDMNDKDASGNLRIKSLPEKQGPDIAGELSKLPLKENRLAATREVLIKGLKQGDKVAVTVKLNGKETMHYLTLGDKGLNLMDKTGKLTSLQEIKGKAKGVKESASQSITKKMPTGKSTKQIPVSKGMRIIR